MSGVRLYKIFMAFTLAEVLITLGIIGVVAAITIPALNNAARNAEFKPAIKKAYSMAQNAYNLSISENGGGFGPYSSGSTLSYTKFNAIKSKMNVISDCPYNTGSLGKCWASTGVGKFDAIPTNCQGFIVSNQNFNASFVTADGAAWMLYTYSATTGADFIAVDVNGAKPPNDWGQDSFIMTMDDTKLILSTTCNFPRKDGTIITDFNYLLQ